VIVDVETVPAGLIVEQCGKIGFEPIEHVEHEAVMRLIGALRMGRSSIRRRADGGSVRDLYAE
jgi:hypothetical protein